MYLGGIFLEVWGVHLLQGDGNGGDGVFVGASLNGWEHSEIDSALNIISDTIWIQGQTTLALPSSFLLIPFLSLLSFSPSLY